VDSQGNARDTTQEDSESLRYTRRGLENLGLVSDVEVVISAFPQPMPFAQKRRGLFLNFVQ